MHRHDDLGDALKDHSLSAGRFVLNRVAIAAAVALCMMLESPPLFKPREDLP